MMGVLVGIGALLSVWLVKSAGELKAKQSPTWRRYFTRMKRVFFVPFKLRKPI
jgi:hypothetical protein